MVVHDNDSLEKVDLYFRSMQEKKSQEIVPPCKSNGRRRGHFENEQWLTIRANPDSGTPLENPWLTEPTNTFFPSSSDLGEQVV